MMENQPSQLDNKDENEKQDFPDFSEDEADKLAAVDDEDDLSVRAESDDSTQANSKITKDLGLLLKNKKKEQKGTKKQKIVFNVSGNYPLALVSRL